MANCHDMLSFVRNTGPRTAIKKTVQRGALVPVDPPSLFGDTNRLCFSPSLVTTNRNVTGRAVSAERRWRI